MTGQFSKREPADTGAGRAARPASRRGDPRPPAAPRGPKEISADWRHLKSFLVTVRGKWDLAVLVNLDRGVERPGDLIETINRQAATDISWKVLIATLRRLEHEGYVQHREISRLPRVTKYWLLPAGHRLISALTRLDAWFEEGEAAAGPAEQTG
jgi:DNA-binding HxlR family transcriptional regulator